MGRKISMREARQIALDNLGLAEGERLESVNFEECEECVELRAENERLKEEIAEHEAILDRSVFDISPCRICGKETICLPDGLPVCARCGSEEE